MYIEQFYIPKIAHLSYLLGGKECCAIVDPSRDVDLYLKAARKMGFKITHILETHLHADFISGHLELKEKTGAKIYFSALADGQFEHQSLKEGDRFNLDDISIEILDTPGHTPEHISYVAIDNSRGKDPVILFSGDTLFVGDVGRPDIFPEKAKELASKLYTSLRKLKELPDFCEVLPTHGAGSFCGKSIGANRWSTVGYEKKYNEILQINSRDKFITSLLKEMPPIPDYFKRCSNINRQGPELVKNLADIKPLKPEQFEGICQNNNAEIIDCRDYEAFGSQHILGSYGIDLGTNFPTFAGWIIPPEKKIFLIASNSQAVQEAVVWLRRVGLDNIIGFLEGGMNAWVESGFRTNHISQVSASEFNEIRSKKKINIIDVRMPSEYKTNHLKGAINIPFPDLRQEYTKLKEDDEYFLICSSGRRSILGISILEKKGFKKLTNVSGGMTGLNNLGVNK
jgi:glyoxylase-like metal-dependent hydrolase (beta-lactamase superfamily II)/rhodanese-related sulfurtransferase